MTVSDILSSAIFPKTYASNSLSAVEEPSFSSSQMASEPESLTSQNIAIPTASINNMSSSDLLTASKSPEIQPSVPSDLSNLAPESTASESSQLSLQVSSSEISLGSDVYTNYSPHASVITPTVDVPFSTSVLPSVSSDVHSVTALPTPTTQGIQPTESAAPIPSTPLSEPISSVVPADKGDKGKDEPTKKSTSSGGGGLSSGGKAAVGIVVALCILGVIIGGIVLYRKYNFTHRSLKSFLTSGVAYKTYNNASYKDDEGMLIMPDRR